jgi:hypothetical protein
MLGLPYRHLEAPSDQGSDTHRLTLRHRQFSDGLTLCDLTFQHSDTPTDARKVPQTNTLTLTG